MLLSLEDEPTAIALYARGESALEFAD